MARTKFTGVLPPILTPLSDFDTVDVPALKRHTANLIDAGCHGIFVSGTTGEGPNLTFGSWQASVEAVVEACAGRVPVYAGAIESSLARTLEKLLVLGRMKVDAAVVTGPYYFRNNDSDLIEYFRRLADASPVGVMVYNIPSMVCYSLSSAVIKGVEAIENIIGLKDSAGDWSLMQRNLQQREREDFEILCGAEPMMAASMLAGADGIVPGGANFAPSVLVDLYEAGLRKDVDAVFQHQQRLADFTQFYWTTDYPFVAMKIAAELMGICGPNMSFIHAEATAEQRERIRAILVREGLL